MDATSIALQGLQQADLQLNQAAASIASTSTSDGSSPDPVSLSAELIALLDARNNFSVNLATLKVAESVQKQSLDVTA